MPIKMVRKPRSANTHKRIVKEEVRTTWGRAALAAVDVLMDDVSDWVEKPEFSFKVTMGKLWTFLIKYDRRTRGGMHYFFVDEGTAERGGKGSAYPIVPVNVDHLAFYVPNYPKTLPVESGRPETHLSTAGPQELVLKGGVMHPGITPRNFTESLRKQLRQKGSKGFKNITDAAIKRGLRKIGKQR